MTLYILRGAFVLLATIVTLLYVLPRADDQANLNYTQIVVVTLGTIAITSVIVAVDVFNKRKKLSALSGVFLGLIAGLVAAYALKFPIDLIGLMITEGKDPLQVKFILSLIEGIKVLLGIFTCYLGISLVMQTKDDFRFVIPYVEFAKQIRGNRPILLDTSILIDGRIVDVVQTQLVQGMLVVPKFVLHELQTIADSADKLRRARGRRGLDMLQQLQNVQMIDVSIDDADVEGHNVDQKLLSLASQIQARVMTNDYNLGKIAKVRGVDIINLNDLAQALRPVVLPGEPMEVKIVKPGEAYNQGVGYLEDGTMVVVENARHRQGEIISLAVTSTLQTSAGRMIFGKALNDSSEVHDTAENDSSYNDEHGQADAGEAADPSTDASGGQPRRNMSHAAQPRRNPKHAQ